MKQKNFRFRWLIIAVMVLAFVPKTVQAETTIEPVEPSSGDGTKDDPYQIASAGNLYWFAALVNGKLTDGTKKNTAACAKLMNHITVNENLFTEKINEDGSIKDGQTVYNWTPIANNNTFAGTFDGQGYTVIGLYFNDGTKGDIGLFGSIIGGCYIKNVGVVDSYFKGQGNVGGVCGYQEYGMIENCYSSGNVVCAVGTGWYVYVGGVCGQQSYGVIKNCHNYGSVVCTTEQNAKVGGVCGQQFSGNSNIENCYYLKDGTNSQYPTKGIGNKSSDVAGIAEGKSADEFGNGSVAWLLNGLRAEGTDEAPLAWYQKLGDDGDKYPVLVKKEGNTVYASHLHCDKTPYEGADVLTNTQPQTVNIDEHKYNLSKNPDTKNTNLYSYICDYCNAAEPGHKAIKKLTKDDDADIEIKQNGTEPWKTTSHINLTDAKYYDAPVKFITTGGVTFKFTRTADVKWATLCLPYKITTSNYTAKCKFYKLNSVGENEIVLGELSGEIAAGTPVFVKSDNDFNVDFSITANTEVEMTTVPSDQSATGGTLIGTFNEKELTTGANANDLFIKENYMWRVGKVNKTMKVMPFRAYIEASSASGGAPAPKLSIVIDGEATAISDALDTLNDTNAEYYDMSGRRINSLQKGVNIIRSGNKTRKVIIK
jgi:hypothetical protein